jgi:hypothetical protein
LVAIKLEYSIKIPLWKHVWINLGLLALICEHFQTSFHFFRCDFGIHAVL